MASSDAELLHHVASGDRTAFAEFYDRHAGRVLGLLRAMLRAPADADDVLQETFAQVWARAAQYDPARSSAAAWLVLIARSRARDYQRRHRRIVSPPPEGAAPAVQHGDLERRESAGLARSALDRLPAEQRAAVALSFFRGLTHEEIARVQSLPLGTVKTRIRLGMQRLRELLQQKYKEVSP
jgi:RNA polymerase sigma-70 factor (ECF subfamily)